MTIFFSIAEKNNDRSVQIKNNFDESMPNLFTINVTIYYKFNWYLTVATFLIR